MLSGNIHFLNAFPDFTATGFNINEYNKQFRENNVIIHASSGSVSYPEHWGCLSIKCAFHGTEYYQAGKRFYVVNDTNYLVLNEGTNYSSYIFSARPVESFTINFSHEFEMEAINSLLGTPESKLDNFGFNYFQKPELTEKLNKHDELVSTTLCRLFSLSSQVNPDKIVIRQLYYQLIENLLCREKRVHAEMQKIPAIKASTRIELYRRLYYAKDFIDSCYMTEITLDKIAGIAHLNTAYFLRLFKNYFGITPYQYIIKRRLLEAKALFETSNMSATEVCFSTGYQDLTSFIKLFKRHFGPSPELYKKQHCSTLHES